MKKIFLFLSLFCPIGCATTNSQKKDISNPPEINENTSIEQAVSHATVYGGKTLQDSKALIVKKNAWPEARSLLEPFIIKNMDSIENFELMNAVTLFQQSQGDLSKDLFVKMISSPRSLARQLGWQLAASKPSKVIGESIERELTRALAENEEQKVLLPQMAVAVQTHKLKSVYSVLRQGLYITGQEAFASAMASVSAKQASEDFLVYLSMAPIEELRQITLTSVNPFSCMIALNHLLRYPASVANPQIEYLFLFSVSRNTALADLANLVLDNYFASARVNLAQTLARLPTWVQVAYVENVRRSTTPAKNLFLTEFKKVTAQVEVLEEINTIQR